MTNQRYPHNSPTDAFSCFIQENTVLDFVIFFSGTSTIPFLAGHINEKIKKLRQKITLVVITCLLFRKRITHTGHGEIKKWLQFSVDRTTTPRCTPLNETEFENSSIIRVPSFSPKFNPRDLNGRCSLK
jgi:hypothetical protein